MKTLIINGSPKVENSGSGVLINRLKKYARDIDFDEISINFKNYKKNISKKINQYNKIILFCPLYADGLPSHLLEAIENISKNIRNNIKIYAVINCGLIEGIHAKQGLNVIENFSESTDNQYMGGLGFGGCGGIKEMEDGGILKFFDKRINRKIKKLANSISKNAALPNAYASITMPRWLYRIVADISWKKEAKKKHVEI